MLRGSLNSKTLSIVLVALICLILLVGCSNVAPDDSSFSDETVEQLDAAVAKQIDHNNVPGVVVGVWVPGEGEYVVARGEANLKTGEQRDIDDPFWIGSITKTFTATAVLQLVEEGKLSKSDRLSKWYPEFPNAEQITVGDLLRMRSGLVEMVPEEMWESEEEFWEAYEKNRHADISTEDMIDHAANSAAEKAHPSDQRTEYSNINYILLGEIVEKDSDDELGTYITKNILKPLDMDNTVYPVEGNLPGDLHGYRWDLSSGDLVDTTIMNPAMAAGAGAMISDIQDLNTWAEAVCTGELLEPETHRPRLQTRPLDGAPDYLEYGEGIMKMEDFCGHGGEAVGFTTEMWYLEERDATIVISVNRSNPPNRQPASLALAMDITGTLFPQHVDYRW